MDPWFSVSIHPVGFLTVSSPVPNQQQQPIVEDAEDLIVQAEASEDAIVEDGEDLQIQTIDNMHMSSCHITLAKQSREIKKLNRQRDQAIKQARHWQAQAQQQRAKVCKLEAENKELLQWVLHIEIENEDEQQRQNFPPGVPLPSGPLSDFQDDPPVLVPKPPVGPPPSYLIKRFQSQTSSSSSQKVLLGLNKAMAIGKTIGKKSCQDACEGNLEKSTSAIGLGVCVFLNGWLQSLTITLFATRLLVLCGFADVRPKTLCMHTHMYMQTYLLIFRYKLIH